MRSESRFTHLVTHGAFGGDPERFGLYIGGHELPADRSPSRLRTPSGAATGAVLAGIAFNHLANAPVANADTHEITRPPSQVAFATDMVPETTMVSTAPSEQSESPYPGIDRPSGNALGVLGFDEDETGTTPRTAIQNVASYSAVAAPALPAFGLLTEPAIESHNITTLPLPDAPELTLPVIPDKRQPQAAVPAPAPKPAPRLLSADQIKQQYIKRHGTDETGHMGPSELRRAPSLDGSNLFHPDMATAMEAFARLYEQKRGKPLQATDSYRSYPEQVRLKREKPALAATPGKSDHGLGAAADLVVGGYKDPRYEFLQTYGPGCGIISPPWSLEGGSGPHEPWHVEMGGGDISKCGTPNVRANNVRSTTRTGASELEAGPLAASFTLLSDTAPTSTAPELISEDLSETLPNMLAPTIPAQPNLTDSAVQPPIEQGQDVQLPNFGIIQDPNTSQTPPKPTPTPNPPTTPEVANPAKPLLTTADIKELFPAADPKVVEREWPIQWQALQEQGLTEDPRVVAYLLATNKIENPWFRSSQDEIGATDGSERYGEYFGRGRTQLTWRNNYADMQAALRKEYGMNVDLVGDPDLMHNPLVDSRVYAIFQRRRLGMINAAVTSGDFAAVRKNYNGSSRTAGKVLRNYAEVMAQIADPN
jgi:predicted chitinase